MLYYSINVDGVEKLLDGLQGHKAHGPDGIPARLLKEFAHNMVPLLTHIYKASLHQYRLPCDWKTALVFPIYKKDSRKNPINYRPISLTSKPCKILEHLIYTSVYNHLELTLFYLMLNIVLGKNDLVRLNLSSP